MSLRRCCPVVLTVAALAMGVAGTADAQWVMLAKRAVGRVQSMSQASQDGAVTFDTAAVIVAVPPEKVYSTVKQALEKATATQGVIITREDAAAHVVQFSKGDQSATLQVISLGDKLAQLMVSSVQPAAKPMAPHEPPATPVIVSRILAVCKDLNVACSSAAS